VVDVLITMMVGIVASSLGAVMVRRERKGFPIR
jgi:hypothetical protein